MELKALTEIYVPEDAHELARGDAKVVDEAINTGSNLVRVRFRGQTHRVEWAQYIFYCLPATHTANEHDIKHVLELDGTTRQVKFMGLWHEVEWMNDPPAPGVVVKAKILKCDRVMYTTGQSLLLLLLLLPRLRLFLLLLLSCSPSSSSSSSSLFALN